MWEILRSMPLPLIQGGMSVGISLSGLAAAVAREGCIGVIGTAGIGFREKDFYSNFLEANIRALRYEIRRAKKLAEGKGFIGVNIMVALTNYVDMVTTSIEEGVDIIFAGAGMPMDLPKYLVAGSKTKLVPIVSNARAATLICQKWISRFGYFPNAIVVEGPDAGGHLGFSPEQIDDPAFALDELLLKVINAVKAFETAEKRIPVIAAGGIWTGADIHKYLQMGASGVQMATRLVATEECDANRRFKEAYVRASVDDLVIIESPVGLPGRALSNDFLRGAKKGEKKPPRCVCNCIKTCDHKESPYCIIQALINAQKGKLEAGFAFAGKNAYRVREIISVKKLIETLKTEYEDAAAAA